VALIIDGHNLIGRLPGIALSDANDEQALVELLRRYRAHTRQAIIVVFDHGAPAGAAPALSSSGIQVLFARAGHTADALILERLRQERRPQQWTVVTADRELANRARSLRAIVLPPEEFSKRLQTPALQRRTGPHPGSTNPTNDKPNVPGDVDYWLKLFQASAEERKKRRRGG
jgi:uncharacterized protein